MGLDLYAYGIGRAHSSGEVRQGLGSWRCHYPLFYWLESVAMRRGGEAWDEPACCLDLTGAELDELASMAMDETQLFIRRARAALLAGMRVYVDASW